MPNSDRSLTFLAYVPWYSLETVLQFGQIQLMLCDFKFILITFVSFDMLVIFNLLDEKNFVN